MSVIVWDGKMLAADRQSTRGTTAITTSKLVMLETGVVLGWTGDNDVGLAMVRWYRDGQKAEDWPPFQHDKEKWTTVIVANTGGCWWIECEPEIQRVEDNFMAWGSGRDVALGALAMGADAIQAVQVASRFNIYCGRGWEAHVLATGEHLVGG